VKERKASRALLIASLLVALTVTALLMLPGLKGRRQRSSLVGYIPAPAAAEAAEVNSWTQAIQKVKEDRGEPMGKQARMDIPQQLKHYSDTRRFLATQVAESLEHRLENPQDFVDLAAIIRRGEMVELKPASQNYILFGVGGGADKEPFTRYENGKSRPLYGEAELTAEYARIREASAGFENEIAALRQEVSSLARSERTRRARLQAQINEKQKSLKVEQERKEMLDRDYGQDERRQQLLAGYEAVQSLAHSFSGRAYKMDDGRARRDMKVRMLSHLRPEALKVLEEIAVSYRQKFDRPLAITSLVRPEEYQHQLSRTNPNATRIATPPHSTGLAFDILYKYMSAEEQSYIMAELARLKDEGRIEVLRENRDHFHVFAFIDGARPGEAYIRQTLGGVGARAEAKESPAVERAPEKVTPKAGQKNSRRAPQAKERSAKAKRR
jgi:hypothetical protein